MDKLTVIVTTYNKPEYLSKVLLGFTIQSNPNFEIVIADDGSKADTKEVVEWYRANTELDIEHVWQEDQGFRKCAILNKAIVTAKSDYLLFTDDDCVPRNDFIEVHLQNATPGYFLSGGYFKLNKTVTSKVTEESIRNQDIFRKEWLMEKGQERNFKLNKLRGDGLITGMLNRITPTKATWNGHNVSGFKADIIQVNGYNEDMAYGGLDRELGERLINMGIKGKQIRYKAICVHLDHSRPYKTKKLVHNNRSIRDAVKKDGITFTPSGIDKYL
ncbi:glycosyltransferase family 2 protein [Mangrovibacterium lignilyticum]|uniref:glycosyltransferase family 2 protein n=1 Tax=Mangrovibacterium lignilyticum TaxID=2668052 RepID=UPI0013D3B510|nr:glycosyltransferase family 2 protein [Mangrovibacterium lignilyticum]